MLKKFNKSLFLLLCIYFIFPAKSHSQGSRLLITLPHANDNTDLIRGAKWNADETLIMTWGGTIKEAVEQTNGVGACDECLYQIKIWDANTGELLIRMDHESGVLDARWSHNEKSIYSISFDGTARIWDANSGDLIFLLPHEDIVNKMIFNKDESRMLTIGIFNEAFLWDTNTGELLLALEHGQGVTSAVWNNEETQLLTTSVDQTARVWNISSGKELFRVYHDDSVEMALWNEKEAQILTYSFDDSVRLWDARTGEEYLRFQQDYNITGLRWSPDEKFILTWGFENSDPPDWQYVGRISVGDTQLGESIYEFNVADGNTEAIWNYEGSQILISTNDAVLLIDPFSAQTLQTFTVNSLFPPFTQWSKDQQQILTYGGYNGLIQLWDVKSGKELVSINCGYNVSGGIIWNQDQTKLLTWGSNLDGSEVAQVWDLSYQD